jgi:predicted AAA+ superfamily ATPase
MALVRRFFVAPEGSFFLFGPRGTGKTTWLRQALPDALWINLLDPGEYRALGARPERLRERVLGSPPGQRDVVLDEVQRVPELLNVVHDLIESGPPKRYVLTGSSARKLRQGGVDLLGGRAALRTLHPFMAAEWSGFSLTAALQNGLVPLTVTSADPRDVLHGYVGLYLEQEVKAEGLVRNLGDFARFLEAVSFSHGQVLNVSALAREAGVHRKTVQGFLDVLEDLLLSFRLDVFTRRAKRKTAAHPKFYLFDAGVFRSLRPTGPLDRPAEIDGAALEGLVAQHLRAWIAYSGGDASLRTWRTRGGAEVDFVVYGPDAFYAIEVKNTAEVRPADLRALNGFIEDYPECVPLLLYRGKHRMRKGEVLCMPVEEFLAGLEPGVLPM